MNPNQLRHTKKGRKEGKAWAQAEALTSNQLPITKHFKLREFVTTHRGENT